ncbi:MAG: VWA domain-containing protein [Deltaproteobacteria bacterium]|nr:VWA domain-containing protein [Deltaproteobacteria bacterium]
MDAMQAVAAVGIERDLLREALAASLVKEEEDRPLFDETFARFFAAPTLRRKGKHHEQVSAGEGQKATVNGAQSRATERPPKQQRPSESSAHEPSERANEQERQQESESLINQQLESRPGENKNPAPSTQHPAPAFQSPRRTILEKPFKAFDSRDVEAAKGLVEELARRLRGHLSRRYKHSKRGRLDFRRTIRASISHGGVPIEPRLRHRRPGKLDLIALCDLSGSVAVVSDFLLALLAPAAEYFRKVRTFAYVDRPCEVSFEHGHVVPHAALGLYALSDFGKVLQQFCQEYGDQLLTRNTLVLILGDARNNRRPPRPDLLAHLRSRAKKLIWLNPEPRERWNTGDSVIGRYAAKCDVVVECRNLRELLSALKQTL